MRASISVLACAGALLHSSAVSANRLTFGLRHDASTSAEIFRRPPAVSPGSAIRVVAPGSAVAPDSLTEGTNLLASTYGLIVLQDPEVSYVDLYHAGTEQVRATQVVKAATEGGTAAVWTANGHDKLDGTAKIVDGIQDVLIPSLVQAPRWLIGYSDATALHALWARSGILSIYGPMSSDIHSFSQQAQTNLFQILNSHEALTQTFPGTMRYTSRRWPGQSTRGRLLGGNLGVLASLVGSGLLPSFRGAILLVEDTNEVAYSIDRFLATLLRSREFEGVKAIAFGQLIGADTETYTALDLLDRTLAPLGIPVITGLSIGHDITTSLPVVLGAPAEIDEEAGVLRVVAGPVSAWIEIKEKPVPVYGTDANPSEGYVESQLGEEFVVVLQDNRRSARKDLDVELWVDGDCVTGLVADPTVGVPAGAKDREYQCWGADMSATEVRPFKFGATRLTEIDGTSVRRGFGEIGIKLWEGKAGKPISAEKGVWASNTPASVPEAQKTMRPHQVVWSEPVKLEEPSVVSTFSRKRMIATILFRYTSRGSPTPPLPHDPSPSKGKKKRQFEPEDVIVLSDSEDEDDDEGSEDDDRDQAISDIGAQLQLLQEKIEKLKASGAKSQKKRCKKVKEGVKKVKKENSKEEEEA
ncbi:hypothetical protein RQP46_009736 [Phenoliferia psychrophenolica]